MENLQNDPDDLGYIMEGKTMSVTDPRLARELLIQTCVIDGEKQGVLQTSPLAKMFAPKLLGKESVLIAEGQKHRTIRDHLDRYFTASVEGKMSSIFVYYTDSLLETGRIMGDEIADHKAKNVNIFKKFRNKTLGFTAKTLLGLNLKNEEVNDLAEVSENLVDYENELFKKADGNAFQLIFRLHGILSDWNNLNKTNKEICQIVDLALDRKLNEMMTIELPLIEKLEFVRSNYKEYPKDLVEHMILRTMSDSSYMDIDTIRSQILTMLVAGHITTTSSNSIQTHYIEGQLRHQDPEYYEAWRVEVRGMRELVDRLKSGHSWDEVKHLHGTRISQSITEEALRLHTITPDFWRQAVQDLSLNYKGNEIEIKKGQVIKIDINQIARKFSSKLPEPNKFNPRNLHDHMDSVHLSLIPFSAGAHVCIGLTVAQRSAMCMIGGLVEQLDNRGLRLEPKEGNLLTNGKEMVATPLMDYQVMNVVRK
jgi:cytochrome P450